MQLHKQKWEKVVIRTFTSRNKKSVTISDQVFLVKFLWISAYRISDYEFALIELILLTIILKFKEREKKSLTFLILDSDVTLKQLFIIKKSSLLNSFKKVLSKCFYLSSLRLINWQAVNHRIYWFFIVILDCVAVELGVLEEKKSFKYNLNEF